MDVVIRIAPPDTAGRLFYERNMMAQEPEIHRLLLEKTQVPVPRILAYDTTRHVLDRDFLVMERLPGRPLTEVSPLTLRRLENVFRQMGQHLAQVHAITAQKYIVIERARRLNAHAADAHKRRAFALAKNLNET
jgi:aminoglycoside phosphotransferase (APT) family kinase protein